MAGQNTKSGSVSARVMSASLWVFGSQILTLGLVFIAQRIVLSTLDPASNGTLFLERRLTEVLVGLFADFGMNGIVVRRVAQDPANARGILASAFYLRLALWSIATLVLGVAAQGGAYDVADILMWSAYMLIASRTTLLRYTLEVPWRAASDFRLPAVVAVLDAVLFAALVTLWQDALTPTAVITAFLTSAVPGFLLLLVLDRGRSTSMSSASMGEMRSLLREALPVISAIVLISLHDKIDAFLVTSFAGLAAAGVLGAAYTTLGPILAVIPMAVSYAAMPDVSRLLVTDERKGLDVAVGVLKHLLVISLLVTSVATIVMPFFVDIVTKGQYTASLDQFLWFVWTAPFVAVLVYAQEVSVAMQRQQNVLRIAIALVVGTVGFGLLLIPSMSSLGAVLAKVITSILGASVSLWLLHQTMGNRINVQFAIRCIVLCAAAGCVSLGLADRQLALKSVSMAVVLETAGRIVAALLGVMGLSFLTGLLGRDDIRRVVRGIRGI
ncbi:MAG: hypothetical protein RL594_1128 [Bacteroidota bacterium]